jgi:SAM-dependent methyltransferase
MLPPMAPGTREHAFYNAADDARYGRADDMPSEFRDPALAFVRAQASTAIIVEIGAGRGTFAGCHPGYVATDLSLPALRSFPGARIQCNATALPFGDQSIDAFFSIATFEHLPRPGAALIELDRCLRPGGSLLLYPAWYVRPWASQGLHVRSYEELSRLKRVEKAAIGIRDRKPYQFVKVLPGRLRGEWLAPHRPVGLSYRHLEPNLERFVCSDSDAFASLDPHAVSTFFRSRGYRDRRRATVFARLLYGYEPVVVEKPR